jgi:type IV secretory pathway protease TraF
VGDHENEDSDTPVFDPGDSRLAVPPCGAVAALAAIVQQPSVPWNRSASEPTGLYVRTAASPVTAKIIAFHAPASAFPYTDNRMGCLIEFRS